MSVEELLSGEHENIHPGLGVLTPEDRSNYIDNLNKTLVVVWNTAIEKGSRGELSPLAEAVARADCKAVASIVKKNPSLINERDEKIGFSPLEFAVAECMVDVLDIMMDFPYEPNALRCIEGAHFTLLDLATVSSGFGFSGDMKRSKEFLGWFVGRLAEVCEQPRSVYLCLQEGSFDELYDRKRNILGR